MEETDSEYQRLRARVPAEQAGKRLDQAMAALFPQFSRARLQQWINDGRVAVDAGARRPRDPVRAGEEIVLEPVSERHSTALPEAIPLDVVFEDDHVLVLDKPPGLVVHPAAGNPAGTLLNALLHHDPGLAQVPRAGIVHRLDKDTSGLMVVARSLVAHKHLVAALQRRSVGREYLALVCGQVVSGGTVEAPVGRHPSRRTQMAVVGNGRPAVTHYRVAERFRHHTLLDVRLDTGRTHQIRVHMAHLHFPIFGDPVYGGRLRLPQGVDANLAERLRGFGRQALHAARLTLDHPASGAAMSWQRPPPSDMRALLVALRQDRDRSGGRGGAAGVD